MNTNRRISLVGGAARRGVIFAAAVLLAASTLLPAVPAFAQRSMTVPAGTTVDLRVETGLDSTTARPGDEFKAVVLSSVIVNGVEVIPSGSVVTGTVADVVQNRSFGRPSGVAVRVGRITSPTGASVDIFGDLADSNGSPLVAVDNLTRGTRLSLLLRRAVTVDDTFFGGNSQDDVFDSPATITQAQIILRDLGYYTGRVDGRMSPATRASIAQFQRDQRLDQTGFLDRTTLDRLGLISQSGTEVSQVNVISANATVTTGDVLNLRIVAQGATGMTLFEDHFRQRDALHVYVRAFRNTTSVRTTNDINVTLRPEEWRGVTRIVVHGSGNDIVIRDTDLHGGNVITPQEAAVLEAQISGMLNDYARILGVRYNRLTGQLQFGALNYRENETELLFALNSLASTAKLYTQLIRTSNDPQAIAGATDIFVQQANAVDHAIARTKSGRAAGVANTWAQLRDEFQRLDDAGTNRFEDTPAYR